MGLRPAKSDEKLGGDADWADGGADPLVRAGRPRPAAGPTISAPCRAPAGRRGRRPRTRGSAPPFPKGGFSTLSKAAGRGSNPIRDHESGQAFSANGYHRSENHDVDHKPPGRANRRSRPEDLSARALGPG